MFLPTYNFKIKLDMYHLKLGLNWMCLYKYTFQN